MMKNRKYLDWVKTLDCCCMCGAPADDPHHIKGIGHFSGTGMTAPDYLAMPMTRECHNTMHSTSELWPDQWEYIVRTIDKAFREGKIKFT